MLPHYNNIKISSSGVMISYNETNVFCYKNIEVDIMDNNFKCFIKGEKYILYTYNQSGYKTFIIKDDINGKDLCYHFGNDKDDYDYVWDYFETKHQRRKRIIKKIIE